MKKALLILFTLAVLAYIVFAFRKYPENKDNLICPEVNILITNADAKQFIDPAKVKESLIESELNPIGKSVGEINTWDIEQYILRNDHAKTAEVFFTNNNSLQIKIKEKKPILRIMPNVGNGYYLDEVGEKMKLSDSYTAYVPIATGNIGDSIVLKDLYIFAQYLSSNEFWNAQIDQIIVNEERDIQFVTHVGEQLITIGDTEKLDKKLKKLLVFCKDGQNKFGWNKYSRINLKFENQVVCSE